MATKAKFSKGRNSRNIMELVCKEAHIEIKDLKECEDIKSERIFTYLSKYIPDYPTPVEFHITELAHVTDKMSLPEIWKSGGFKGFGEHSLSWWSLKINEADITSAEERYLEKQLQNRSKEERAAQAPLLGDFTTSPLFNNKSSRYGNFRFTFAIHELMEAYKKQMCAGEEPVLRVYATKCFKQEIEYVVLVHSPEFNDQFSDFPEISSSPLVAFKGDQIIWNAQAVCETHKYQLMINGNTARTQYIYSSPFYVWDHVSFVFHTNGVLAFPKQKLKENLSCCEMDPVVKLANGGICSSIEDAEKFIQTLPDNDFEKDEKEEHESVEIKMEVD